MMMRLRKRRDFLRAAKGARADRATLSGQAVDAGGQGAARAPRAGFTVTKKVGTAVVRNRVRRRLRAAVAAEAARLRPGIDYVVIGRRSALTSDFSGLRADIARGLAKVHETLNAGDTRRRRGQPAAARPSEDER
jgi:ribonuclease P protein component